MIQLQKIMEDYLFCGQSTLIFVFHMQLKDASILIVDDDTDVLTAARLLFKSQAKEVVTEKNPENLRGIFMKRDFDLVLMDMNFNSSINTGNEGLYWLRKIRDLGSKAAIIMITAYGDIDLAVRSLKEGASDFTLKPWQNDQLIQNIKELLKKRTNKTTARPFNNSSGLLGQSEAMEAVRKKIEKIAPTDANILILGENGTGKDLVAHAIHQQSLRAQKPFIKTDVGALTESLFLKVSYLAIPGEHLQMRAKIVKGVLKQQTKAPYF